MNAGNSHITLAGFIGLSLCLHAALLLSSNPAREVSASRQTGTLSVALLERHERPSETAIEKTPPVDKAIPEEPAKRPAMQAEQSAVAEDSPSERTATAKVQRNEPQQASQEKTAAPSLAGNEIKRELKARLRTHFEYPLLAVRRGWQGDVQLSFRILANGRLINIRVARSSGHILLDRSAMEALQRVGRLRDSRHWLQENHLDMTLPIRYQLTEG